MVTIEFNGRKIQVPESWDDVTLGQYEQFYALKPDTNRGRVALIAQVCGIEADVLLSWPAEIFNAIVGYVMFLYGDNPVPPSPACEIDGITYVVPVEDSLSLGAFVDAEEAQKGAAPLSNTLAIVCRPVNEPYDYKNNDARAAMFAAQPVSKVLGVMGFFLQCKTVLERHTQAFGALQQAADLLPRNTEFLRSRGGGIKSLLTWRGMKFYILNALLRYRLRKYLRSYNTVKTRPTPKKRNAS